MVNPKTDLKNNGGKAFYFFLPLSKTDVKQIFTYKDFIIGFILITI
jgi:hypothetical protein